MSDLVYPKNGGVFLLERITEMHGMTADLIDELVKKDQALAEKDAEITRLLLRLAEWDAKLNAPDRHPSE